MKEIVNKFLLAVDKFMPEMHLTQPDALGKKGFIYSACGPFNKSKKFKSLKKKEIQNIFIEMN